MHLMREVDELVAIRRDVAAPFINSATQPLSRLEAIALRVPQDHPRPARRATAQDDASWRSGRKVHVQPRPWRGSQSTFLRLWRGGRQVRIRPAYQGPNH